MKTSAAILVLSLVSISPALVMGTPIAKWTFEGSIPTTAGPCSPEIGSGTGTAFHIDGSTAYSNPVGNGSGESWGADRWSVGDYFQFQLSTAGYMNIMVNYDQYRSPAAPGIWDFAYSVDGVNFVVALNNYSASTTGWSSGSSSAGANVPLNFNGISILNNASTVYFRIVADSSASSTSGASRIDNFTVSGTEISANVPDSIPPFAGLGCVLGLLEVLRRIRNVSSPLARRHT